MTQDDATKPSKGAGVGNGAETSGTGTSYTELLRAFQSRLADLERENTDLDELAVKLDEGFALLERLKTKLSETEARIEDVIRVRHTP